MKIFDILTNSKGQHAKAVGGNTDHYTKTTPRLYILIFMLNINNYKAMYVLQQDEMNEHVGSRWNAASVIVYPRARHAWWFAWTNKFLITLLHA